jgi:chromosome condensin MukBEF complex kleisin-like MukF subunit
MLRNDTNRLMDEYEQHVDEIIAACRGDLRGAVKALMLINERLEQTLRRLSAVLVEKAGEDQSPRQLH